VHADLVGAADGLRRVAQHLLQARGFQHRDRVLAQQLVAGRGRVHAIGEQVGVGRIRADVAGRVAGQDALVVGRIDLAGGAGDVGEAVHARVGGDFRSM
jgi:hypothetical protein